MAKRQEQETAREEVTEVAPGVLRMELPISMPGLGHVNCYALVDGQGAALVDPGLPTPGSFKALEKRLARADLKVKDVHTVVVTHSHPDHFGGAVRLVKESGARLLAHSAFRLGLVGSEPEVSVDDLHAHGHSHSHTPARVRTWGEDPAEADGPVADVPVRPARTPEFPLRRGGPTPWGGNHPRPPFKMRMRWAAMRLMGNALRFPAISHPLERGDVVRLCGREWFVVHTPGHTEDHICLHDPAEQVFLAGDHVLPTITPHISGITHSDDPLKLFFDSLDQVAALPDVGQVLPAHGHPFDDLAGRCEAIKRHHDERLAKVHAIARELGPATVEAFTQKLFKPRSWGAMAESETFAHLEHIRLLGEAESHRDEEGKLVYEL